MLAHPQSTENLFFTTHRSSPLAARSPNAFAVMSPLSPSSISWPVRDGKTTFAARQSKANPLVQRQKESGERRRRVYLQKGRQASENRRWQARGGEDEIMRLVWLSEQKRWEDEQASLADDLAMEESDDDRDMQKKRQPLPNASEMVEDIVRTEDEDLQALVEMLQNEPDSLTMSLSQNTQHRIPTGMNPEHDCTEDLPDSDFLALFEASKDLGLSIRIQELSKQSMDVSEG